MTTTHGTMIDGRLAGLPAEPTVTAAAVRSALDGAPVVVVLDDDPTGTQTVRDVPVLTRWRPEDVAWALDEGGPGFFVLTNTRGLSEADAAARVAEVVRTCLDVAGERGVRLAFASRGDSTLRGHFPLETDVVRAELGRAGGEVDGVVLSPAYVDAGRITLDSVHLLRTPEGFRPVADSEFARDATFGFRSASLPDWVAEKSGGRIPAGSVATIGIDELRSAPRQALAARIGALRDGGVLVVDAVVDADLRALALAVLDAERSGRSIVYRIGPSFVRARLGQEASGPVPDDTLRSAAGSRRHGLVAVGSHVGLTSRQLGVVLEARDCAVLEIDVPRLLASGGTVGGTVGGLAGGLVDEDLVARAVAALASRTVVLHTSRALRSDPDPDESLRIARRVSAALTATVRRIAEDGDPAYVVAKGGITSSEIATDALDIARARVRGPVLDGIVSLWEAADGPHRGLPYVVFAGNVGDDESLLAVVERLEPDGPADGVERLVGEPVPGAGRSEGVGA